MPGVGYAEEFDLSIRGGDFSFNSTGGHAPQQKDNLLCPMRGILFVDQNVSRKVNCIWRGGL